MRTLGLGAASLRNYVDFENSMSGELTLRQVLDLEHFDLSTFTFVRYMDTSSVEEILNRLRTLELVVEPVRGFENTDVELLRFLVGDTLYIVQYEDIAGHYESLLEHVEKLRDELVRRGYNETEEI